MIVRPLCRRAVHFKRADSLSAQAEAGYHFVVLLDIFSLQIIEQPAALLDHFQQPTARVMVFLVSLEVLGQFADARAEQRDLHLGRARVRIV